MAFRIFVFLLVLVLITFLFHSMSLSSNIRSYYSRDIHIITNQTYVSNQKTPFDVNASCDVAQVITSLYDPQTPLTWSTVNQLRGCVVLLYFRTPRCGSTAIWKLFNKLAKDGEFQSVMPKFGQKRSRWVSYLNTITRIGRPSVITSHHRAEQLNTELTKPAAMFNIIRHPIDHTLSIFKLRKYGDRYLAGSQMSRRCNVSFSEYVLQHGVVKPCITDHYLGLRFLCGACVNCTSRSVCLQQAKKNVETLYLTVGISENIPAFLNVMETLLPQFFRGALHTYVHQPGLYMMSSPDPKRNETITPEVLDHLQHVLAPDLEIYHFVQQRCYVAMKKVLEYQATNTANDSYNRLV